MRIIPLCAVYTPKKPVFRSKDCEYDLPNYNIMNNKMGLYTRMFREDQNWEELAELEIENFKNKDKVNIIQFAPSDGSESYTKILSLINRNPKDAEKFFPIQAYDINADVVTEARSGYITLIPYELHEIVKRGIDIKKFFKKTKLYAPFGAVYKTTDELSKKIQFNKGDMFEILPSIKDNSNTIICARNSLAYFTNRIEPFVSKASQVLKSGSLFVVGLLEEDFSDIGKIFKKHKFEKVMKNVYRKI